MEDFRVESIVDAESFQAGEWIDDRIDQPVIRLTGVTCNMRRETVEKFNAWLTQWLKENPKKIEGWLNLYGDDEQYFHTTKKDANKHAHGGTKKDARIACIPISYHIGQGLESKDD